VASPGALASAMSTVGDGDVAALQLVLATLAAIAAPRA
jgi:hypothetical protein